jgi:hypothetical protein
LKSKNNSIDFSKLYTTIWWKRSEFNSESNISKITPYNILQTFPYLSFWRYIQFIKIN